MTSAVRIALPAVFIVSLFTLGALVAGREGLRTVAVLLVLNGVLIAGYSVRHRARERHLYDRYRADAVRR